MLIEPLNGLERLFVEAATHPDRLPGFRRSLLNAQLYVSPLDRPDDLGQITGVRATTLPAGGEATAIYTDAQRITQVLGPDALVLATNGRALLEWLAPGPLAINPGLAPDLVLSVEDVAALLAEPSGPVQVLLGRPAQTPVELIDRLNRTLETVSEVAEAWLALANQPGEAGTVWILGVRSTGRWEDVQRQVGESLRGYPFDRRLHLVSLEDSDHAAALREAINVVKPRRPSGFVDLTRRG